MIAFVVLSLAAVISTQAPEPEFRVGRLMVVGNTDTPDWVILDRCVGLAPGRKTTGTVLRKAELQLRKIGVFKSNPWRVISVDKHYGMVSDMRARYMVLSKPDGTHVIIPNESLITTAVVNHSLTEHKGRVQIELAISVDSPLELAMQLLQDIAKQHERVLKTPAPVARIKGFNEHGVGLTLTVWVSDPESGVLGLQSALFVDVWKDFRLNKINFVKTEAKPE